LSLKRALLPAVCRHEFPNFQVDVFANVLEDDGSVLVAAITAAGLALADAGVPMYDVLTASSVLIFNDQILNDPTSKN
jgi:exosome complex component MTR3